MNCIVYTYAVLLIVCLVSRCKCDDGDHDDHDKHDGYICSDECHDDDYCEEECFECPLSWEVKCDNKHGVCRCRMKRSHGKPHSVAFPGRGHGNGNGSGYGSFDEELS